MNDNEIHSAVAHYYTTRLAEHGAVARGVDWSTEASQQLRFDVLMGVGDGLRSDYTLLDYGCGYGALLDYLAGRPDPPRYTGFDLSAAMIDAARLAHPDTGGRFAGPNDSLERVDVVVASGIFNVRLDCPVPEWRGYLLSTLDRIDQLAEQAFAFNVLTSYSDQDRRRNDLYYADPLELFDICKRKYSPRIALLHDYPLWEFTIIVRK